MVLSSPNMALFSEAIHGNPGGVPLRFPWLLMSSNSMKSEKLENSTPLKFNCLPLKNGGWKTTFLLGPGNFSGASC